MRAVIMVAGVAALVAGQLLAPDARAEVVTLKAELKGSAEVPPNNSSGTGIVTATYDTQTKTLSWKGSYSGLSGPVTAAHFHGPAAAGQNAPVVVPMLNRDETSFSGSAPVTTEQARDLLAGRWYANFHTETHKGGEIRGQLVK